MGYLGGAVLLIMLGLLSRRISVIPSAIGDALWAMTVYCCWRIVLLRKRPAAAALAAIMTAFAIEFSQLLTMEWLVRLRTTFIGHMLLGQGFLWTDLIAYTIGIAVIFIVTAVIEDKDAAHRNTAGFLSKLAAAGNGKAVEKISPEEAKEIMDSGKPCVILDVRERSEYENGHIRGAVQISVTKIKDRAEEVLKNRDELILVYCASGVRSAIAAKQLTKLGYRNVKDFGGLISWPYEIGPK